MSSKIFLYYLFPFYLNRNNKLFFIFLFEFLISSDEQNKKSIPSIKLKNRNEVFIRIINERTKTTKNILVD